MAWSANTQWIVTLMVMVGSCSEALRCEDKCEGCSTTSIACYGEYDLPDIVSVLPPYTQAFSYMAIDGFISLGEANFELLTELKILIFSASYYTDSEQLIIRPSEQKVFAPLAKLQVLKIHVLWYFDEPLDDLFQPLVNLEELDLSQTRVLNITNLHRALHGLNNSTTLKTINLSNMQMNGFGREIYSTLNLTWFLEPLQNCPIRHLQLANNLFKTIYPGIIRYAPHLEYIDVSHNFLLTYFSFDNVHLLEPAFLQETLLHKELQEIDFSYQDSSIEEQMLGLLDSNPGFSDLEIFNNRKRNLSTGTFQRRIASLIPDDVGPEYWSHCTNILLYNFDSCEIFSPNCSDTLEYLRHNHSQFCELLYTLKTDYSGIPCSALPALDDMYQKNCDRCCITPIMGSTKRLKLIKRNSYDKTFNHIIYTQTHTNLCFHQSNQLEYLDLSGNVDLVQRFFRVPDYQQSTVTGLTHIKVLNVSNTGITSIFSNMLLNFPNLQVMDMSKNRIYFINERSISLSSNRDIQFLSFAHNEINFVPQNLFSNLVSLQKLDLSNTNIQNFDFNISGLYSLKKMNLENNLISEIPEAARKQLIQLAERIAPQIITVDLSNNQLACSCSNIASLSFMIKAKPSNLMFDNFDKYLCRNQADDRIHLHNINLLSMQFDCLESGVYVGIGFACACVVITMNSLLAVIIYRKRWWFRYQYFLAHRVWQNYNKIATFDTPFEYDLFVSYNRCDYQWVDEVLQPKLEDELGLRLCLHHCDFRLGEVITEQIIESVQSSKKTLFILSKSFLASTWCHFEIQMAQSRLFTTGKDVILLALLEPLPDRMISKTLKGLMETRTYVEWTENDTYGQKLSWEKLYESVQAPISHPFDLEERAPPHGIQTDERRDPSLEAAPSEREPLLASSRSELSESWHQVQVHA